MEFDMNAPTTHAAYSSALPRIALLAVAAAEALYAVALRIDAWLARRRHAADDREALASMSDRDLMDIGINRASVDAVAGGAWMRDWPH
jgi:uncharacterized protein YjiS (DUF1127 family)